MKSIVQQGIIVSALHNHWLYMNPFNYVYSYPVDRAPLHFAQKLANSFCPYSYPIANNEGQ
ncbi:DUF1259 domain-containing protein [Bacillus pacificus]